MLETEKYSNNLPLFGNTAKPHNHTESTEVRREKMNNESQTLFFSINNPLSSSYCLRDVI